MSKWWLALCFLGGVTVSLGAQEGEPPEGEPPAGEPERDLEAEAEAKLRAEIGKLFRIDVLYKKLPITFDGLRHQLVTATRAPRGDAAGQAKLDHYLNYQLFRRDGMTYKPVGSCAVLYGGGFRKPRYQDRSKVQKRLRVGDWPTAPFKGVRFIAFEFRVRATEQKKPGAATTLVGDEQVDLVILEDPEDGSPRLLVDRASYLEHRKNLKSNRLEEKKPGGAEEKKEPSTQEKRAREQVSLVKSVEIAKSGMVVTFQRRWSRMDDVLVEANLELRFNRALATTLYYKPSGKKKVKAAYFQKGWVAARGD